MKLILGSGSPRRKQLLQDAGFTFEIITAETDEDFPENLTPLQAAIHIAKDKATAVQEKLEKQQMLNHETVILAADTIVVLENEIIGKPKDRIDATSILRKLSGKTHEVITAVCLLQNKEEKTIYATTLVHFNELTDEQIGYYLDHFKPYDKAGSYAIQEWIGLIGVEKIEGDFYNVIGLPINAVAKWLNTRQ